MPFSLEEAQKDIFQHLETEFAEKIVEQSILDNLLVERDALGNLKPYIAVDFSDIAEAGARTFGGPMTYDYAMPIRCRVVADKPTTARRISNKLVRVMLGYSTEWTGGVTKSRVVGGLLPITTSNMATEAYQMPTGFTITLQLAEY